MRVFVALTLPDNIQRSLGDASAALSAYSRSIGGRARLVPAVNMHITLHFIGDINPADAELVNEAVQDIRDQAPIIRLNGLGCFGSTVFAGLTGETALISKIQQNLGAKLNAAGFSMDSRAFKPHITLVRNWEYGICTASRFAPTASEDFACQSLCVFRSDFPSVPGKPPVYSKLYELPFSAPGLL